MGPTLVQTVTPLTGILQYLSPLLLRIAGGQAAGFEANGWTNRVRSFPPSTLMLPLSFYV